MNCDRRAACVCLVLAARSFRPSGQRSEMGCAAGGDAELGRWRAHSLDTCPVQGSARRMTGQDMCTLLSAVSCLAQPKRSTWRRVSSSASACACVTGNRAQLAQTLGCGSACHSTRGEGSSVTPNYATRQRIRRRRVDWAFRLRAGISIVSACSKTGARTRWAVLACTDPPTHSRIAASTATGLFVSLLSTWLLGRYPSGGGLHAPRARAKMHHMQTRHKIGSGTRTASRTCRRGRPKPHRHFVP